MPNTPDSTTQAPDTVHRTVRLRLYPGDAATGILLTAHRRRLPFTSGTTCWPTASGGTRAGRRCTCPLSTGRRSGKARRRGPRPSARRWDPVRPTSFFTLGQRFTELRNDPGPCLAEGVPVPGGALQPEVPGRRVHAVFADPENAGKPRFKGRHFTVPAFTIPEAVRMDGDRLYVAQGRLAAAGGQRPVRRLPAADRACAHGRYGTAPQVVCVCLLRGTRGAGEAAPPADGALGLDRNVGQATDSEGTVYAMPDTDKLDAQVARKQRELSRKQGLGAQGPPAQVEPGPARERAVAEAAPQTGAQARRCHAPGQSPAGGRGAHRGGGGSEHEGHDPVGQGHGGGTRQAGQAEVGAQPGHPGVRLGAPGSASWRTRPANC